MSGGSTPRRCGDRRNFGSVKLKSCEHGEESFVRRKPNIRLIDLTDFQRLPRIGDIPDRCIQINSGLLPQEVIRRNEAVDLLRGSGTSNFELSADEWLDLTRGDRTEC
jgi:hypothetical protein